MVKATAPAQTTDTDIAQMAETKCEGSAPCAPGSNTKRCTPMTTAVVTIATFIIGDARAQPATGRRWEGVSPSTEVGSQRWERARGSQAAVS
eukprot:6185112-Pleurochrysis_carterae.AAC.4